MGEFLTNIQRPDLATCLLGCAAGLIPIAALLALRIPAVDEFLHSTDAVVDLTKEPEDEGN